MSSPAHSLHVAVAAPATTPSVSQPDLYPDEPLKAISFSFCASCDLAINTPSGHSEDSRATGFYFLCCPPPVAAFHMGTIAERFTGRREICLFAFPHHLGRGIVGPCCISFELP
jgi:hypothetical protein